MRSREELVGFADRLIDAATDHASPDHALITMPGPVGGRGARTDGLEGFARTFLLAALRIAGSDTDDTRAEQLSQWYSRGIAAGVDPGNPNRWVRPREIGQARVEAASIALGLDMTRRRLWDHLDPKTQGDIVDYLAEVIGDDDYPPNNWLWFRVVTETFLRSVGGPWVLRDLRFDLERYGSFLREGGWVSDGHGRKFDHYAGWAMHLYPTLWQRMQGADELIEQLDPRFPGASRLNLEHFLDDALSLVGGDGSPLIQGRSLIYRFAAAAPFWAGAIAPVSNIPLGQLRHTALAIVGHFMGNGVPDDDGVLTLGWHHEWPRMSQSYSGPSSPYWASKGLLGIALPPDHPVWTDEEYPMVIERGSFARAVSPPGWVISGTDSDGIVRVVNHGTDNDAECSTATDSPLYARFAYSTATSPLLREQDWDSPADQSVALLDARGQGSHRAGMVFLGSGSLGSESIPPTVTSSSLAHLHWVIPDPDQDMFGGGRSGTSTGAGTILVHSIVRGAWEVRVIRVLHSHPDASALRCSGWPITGAACGEHVAPSSAATWNERGLSSTLVVPGSRPAEIGLVRADDATPLGPITTYPFVDLTPRSGKEHVLVLELKKSGPDGGASAQQIDAGVRRVADGGLTVDVSWPDGTEDQYHFETFADRLAFARDQALELITATMEKFGDDYPADHTVGSRYPLRTDDDGNDPGGNYGWTSGFWVGTLALAQQLSGDPRYLSGMDAHLSSFSRRLTERIDVDHHDIGFLYSLAGTLPYELSGDERLREMSLRAADVLMGRYLEGAGIIQAWGDLNDRKQRGRAIIDSLMNLPLLYWATRHTGDPRYEEAARSHSRRLVENIIRDDDSTYHTFHFEPETGDPLHGSTAQGAADDSTWARGQAWGIYGFALSYLYTGDPEMLEASIRCSDRFLDLLPQDSVPYWDMIFVEDDDEPRDSSSAAIAVCGLLELADALTADGRPEVADKYRRAAIRIMASLIEDYATKPGESDALIDHSVYSKPDGRGVDEGSVWGDYFYLEAIARLVLPEWVSPWTPRTMKSGGPKPQNDDA